MTASSIQLERNIRKVKPQQTFIQLLAATRLFIEAAKLDSNMQQLGHGDH